MKLTSILTGVALAAAAFTARADLVENTYALSPGANAGQFHANFDATHLEGGIFVDTLTFNAPQGAAAGTSGTVTLDLFSLDNLTLFLGTLNGQTLDFSAGGPLEFTFNLSDLFSGPLTLTLFGSVGDPFNPTNPATASYAGAIEVQAALPEPASLALVIGALGALFLVRGRLRAVPQATAC